MIILRSLYIMHLLTTEEKEYLMCFAADDLLNYVILFYVQAHEKR